MRSRLLKKLWTASLHTIQCVLWHAKVATNEAAEAEVKKEEAGASNRRVLLPKELQRHIPITAATASAR